MGQYWYGTHVELDREEEATLFRLCGGRRTSANPLEPCYTQTSLPAHFGQSDVEAGILSERKAGRATCLQSAKPPGNMVEIKEEENTFT